MMNCKEVLNDTLSSSSWSHDRLAMYEDVLIEIQKCKDRYQKAKSKLEVLKDVSDDLFLTEVENDFKTANRIFERLRISVDMSKEEWMPFDCLPQLAMKHILQFLDIDDKLNLRLTSRSLKKILDIELEIFCTINLINTIDSWLWPDVYHISFCFFEVEDEILDNHLSEKAVNALCEIFERVTEILGTADFFKNLEDKMINFTNVKKVEVESSRLPQKLLFQNLKILQLSYTYIENIEGGVTEYMFDQLEELHMSNVSYSNRVHALLSACRNIKCLAIDGDFDFDVAKSGISMPNLRRLQLARCSPKLLYIVMESAYTLTDLSLSDVDPKILTTSDIQIPNLSRLSLSCCWGRYDQEYKDLIAKVSSSVQELDIRIYHSKTFEVPISDFPKLKTFSFIDLPTVEAIKIIKHSPNLKYVKEGFEGKVCYPVTKPSDQPDTLYLGTTDFEVDEDKFLEAFNKPHKHLGKLFSFRLNFEISELNNCELFKLAKIAMVECFLHAGLDNILNKCCSTLKELKLEYSSVQIDGEISELKSLKHISIICPCLDQQETRSESTLNKLLKASSSSLEKLTLTLPPEPDMLSQIFDQVQLPNLKILHVYPRLPEQEFNLFLKHLPDDLTVWYFKPETTTVHSVFYPEGRLELIKLVCPNMSFVNISK